MPTEQPSNAPDSLPAAPAEEATAAAVLRDEQLDDTPGGGGLGGAAAADPLSGSGRAAGATSPNNPATPPNVASDETGDASREAALQAVESPAAEPHPSSR